jgi:hypothetical protein
MKAILLVPAPGDPHGLLAPGKCGAMPPIMGRWPLAPDHWIAGVRCPEIDSGTKCQHALVLAWDGEPVPEGCDRALRRIGYASAKQYDSLNYVVYCARLVVSRLGGEVVVIP